MTWLVLVPPLLVIVCALYTQRMILSFFVGIAAACLIATQGSPYQALLMGLNRLWQSSGLNALSSWQSFITSWNLLIFLFLCCLGILTVLLRKSGSADAFARIAQRRVNSPQAAEKASLLLSLFFFLDDYFSSLTVGSIMRPVAHYVGLSPVKLAFLVTAFASPLAVLSPISSWIGEIILQLKQAGIDSTNPTSMINADPLTAYLYAIPTIFYSLILLVTVWYIVVRKISYGPMAHYDREAHANKSSTHNHALAQTNNTLADFLIPLSSLIIAIVTGMLVTGNYWLFGGSSSLLQAFKQAAINQAFFIGGIVSLAISVLWFIARKHITLIDVLKSIQEGIALMLPSLIMLICAWSLGSLLKQDLHTGAYIAQLFGCCMTPSLAPFLSFIFSAIVAWMIGSAWAAMGLMFPIIFEMLKATLSLPAHVPLSAVPLIIPTIGAILSGCILGTHFSFLSDTPIMTSTSTGAHHVEHVKTMAWYLLPVALGTASAYASIGFLLMHASLMTSIFCAYSIGLIVTLSILELLNIMLGKGA